MRAVPGLTAALLAGALALAQYGDISDVKVAKKEDKQDVKTAPPPRGAKVLFDGKGLDGWVYRNGGKPAKWKLTDGGAMQVHGGDVHTKEKFAGKFKLHVEFRVPYEPKKSGQARGNSGVYLQGRYEVQVLDSYGVKKPQMGDCGAIYGVAVPKTNASKAPTVWQSYDIEFTAPRFQDGRKVRPAAMTVIQNGIPIHQDRAIPVDNTRAGLGGDPSQPGPIMLQSHAGDPVEYRNIWLMPLD